MATARPNDSSRQARDLGDGQAIAWDQVVRAECNHERRQVEEDHATRCRRKPQPYVEDDELETEQGPQMTPGHSVPSRSNSLMPRAADQANTSMPGSSELRPPAGSARCRRWQS